MARVDVVILRLHAPAVGRRLLAGLALGLATCVPVTPADAHPLAPALLELREQGGDVIAVRFKTSLFVRSQRAGESLVPLLPDSCRAIDEGAVEVVGSGRVVRFQAVCPGGLVGRRVGVGGLGDNRIDALLRVELADGRSLQRVLRAGRASLVVPARPGPGAVVASYAEMGARHIFSGPDHLLFVFGLVLLVAPGAGYVSRLLLTLSAFTVGHCVTLSLAALGWIRLPSGPVELTIAVSVLVLAVELARNEGGTRSRALPWLLAGSFGLLHGLGFAGALLEAGLPGGDIPLALVSFNLGIEAGQVFVVVGVLSARTAFRVAGALVPHPREQGVGLVPALARRARAAGRRLPAYAMGSLAAMWCIERARALLS